MNRFPIAFAAVALLLGSSLLARADEDGRGPGRGGQCRDEISRACPDLRPGDGKFADCVKQHKSDLSDRCQKVVQRFRGEAQKFAEAREACKADGERFCPGMQPGDGKFGPCMKEHLDAASAKDRVSPKCRALIKRAQKRSAYRKARRGPREAASDEKNDEGKNNNGDKDSDGDEDQ